jgi:hypothetical protein
MAEAAGLALGAVAFAGLFSTCVECLDYLSQAQTYTRDVQVALTKLDFLQQRLTAWHKARTLRESDDDDLLAPDTGADSRLVTEALVVILDILEALKRLCMRYQYSRRHLYGLSHSYHGTCNGLNTRIQPSQDSIASMGLSEIFDEPPGVSDRSYRCGSTDSDIHALPRKVISADHPSPTIPPLVRFRLKLTWVLGDRRKFNSLISDLEFLLSSLERLSDTSSMVYEQDQRSAAQRSRTNASKGPRPGKSIQHVLLPLSWVIKSRCDLVLI